MAKELPYFRFTAQEWQNGNISLESYELKGLFIDICAYYWVKDCSITLAMLKKRFNNANESIDYLLSSGILKLEDDYIQINFLNEQFDVLSEARLKRQEAGRLGGLTKHSNAKAMLKQCSSYKDKDNNKETTWRESFEVYLAECKQAFTDFWTNEVEMERQQKFHPNLNIHKCLEKAYFDYWATEAGWEQKKKKRSTKVINWTLTIKNAIAMNKVYYTKQEQNERDSK